MSLIDKQHVFDYPMNINLVFERIMSVSRSVKGLRFSHTLQPYKVILEAGTSLWSWGETVTISCLFLDESHTRVMITSVPNVSTTLVDWGKGKKNINNVLGTLRQVLGPVPDVPPPVPPPLPPPLP